MIQYSRYLTQYGSRAMAGDPAALTILAAVGIIAAGAYVVDKIQKNADK